MFFEINKIMFFEINKICFDKPGWIYIKLKYNFLCFINTFKILQKSDQWVYVVTIKFRLLHSFKYKLMKID